MNMFKVLFKWTRTSRKEVKCKNLLERLRCRIKILNHKRETIIRHSRDDIVQLLKKGEHREAFAKVNQLSKDQSIFAAYDLVDRYCEFLLLNIPRVWQQGDCQDDIINEAVSSLLYASSRCGDLLELPEIRKLFEKRYEKHSVMVAVNLLDGNLVNNQIIKNFNVNSISNDVKCALMKQIALDNGLDLRRQEGDASLELQQTKDGDVKLKEIDHLYEPEISKCSFSSQSSQGVSTASSEIPFQLSEKNIVDDVEEFKVDSNMEECSGDEYQRVFIFKSTNQPRTDGMDIVLESYDYDLEAYEPSEHLDGKASCRSTPNRRKAMNMSIKDVETEKYYHKDLTGKHQHLKKHPTELSFEERRFYSRIYNGDEYFSIDRLSPDQRKGEELHSEEEKNCNVRRSDGTCYTECNRKDSSSLKQRGYFITTAETIKWESPATPRRLVQEADQSCASSTNGSSSTPLRQSWAATPSYVRTMGTPSRRPSDHSNRSSSASGHVHPNLPDYDQTKSMFRAMKDEYLNSSRS